jgi:hypothetical protein
MKKLYALLLLLSCISTGLIQAQTRYLNEVFSAVKVTYPVVYGQNATVLGYPNVIKQPLVMSVYQPASDAATNRPVVLYLHTGNFLPFFNPVDGTPGLNGACGGTINDSAAVEICTRLAKMGYVACSIDYRTGWNPLAATDVLRRYGIINAAYRGVQDLRSCIRYLHRNVLQGNNQFGIDTSRIVVWGQGTGGYITLAAGCLDNYIKIPTASDGKFLYDHDNNPATNPIPMVIPQINGDINGTSYGIAPNAAGTGVDTLCYPNHVGYSSKFALAVNMGGACADSAWVKPGQPPLISYHVPTDIYAPYGEGIVKVPGTDLNVVKVQGSFIIQHMKEGNGDNASMVNKQPVLSAVSLGGSQQHAFDISPTGFTELHTALYPFNMPIVSPGPPPVPLTTAPWEWTSFTGNGCTTTKAQAIPYIDTIVQFYAPRACFALGLQGCINQILSANEPLAEQIPVAIAPNPARDVMTLTADATHEILNVQLFSNLGRLVQDVHDIKASTYTLQRNNLPAGTYVVKLSFKEGFVTKMVSFQ